MFDFARCNRYDNFLKLRSFRNRVAFTLKVGKRACQPGAFVSIIEDMASRDRYGIHRGNAENIVYSVVDSVVFYPRESCLDATTTSSSEPRQAAKLL